jgi:uncharacterized protein with HEPN domain
VNERDELRLRHVLDAAERISDYLSGIERDSFLSNRLLQDAVVRNLEIIGEACVNLTSELREANAHVPWQKVSAIRNRLVHGYFDVDVGVVWQTVKDSLPPFLEQVRVLLDKRGS